MPEGPYKGKSFSSSRLFQEKNNWSIEIAIIKAAELINCLASLLTEKDYMALYDNIKTINVLATIAKVQKNNNGNNGNGIHMVASKYVQTERKYEFDNFFSDFHVHIYETLDWLSGLSFTTLLGLKIIPIQKFLHKPCNFEGNIDSEQCVLKSYEMSRC